MSYWNRTFQLGADSLGQILLIVEVVFALLTLFGLLGLFLGTLLLRVRRGQDLGRLPVVALLGSQLSFMVYVQSWSKRRSRKVLIHICPDRCVLIEAINCILIIRSTTVTGYYYVGQIIEEFCIQFAFCLLFFVFNELVDRFIQKTTDSSKRPSRLKPFAWTILAIIVALSIVDWAYYIYYIDTTIFNPSYSESIYWTWARIAAVRCIVFLAASVGIASKAIFITLKMKSRTFKVSSKSILPVEKHADVLSTEKIPAYLLLLGAVFFFAWNLLWAIWAIRWYLASKIQNTIESTYMARTITQCFLCLGTYLGLALYCGKHREQDPSSLEANMGFSQIAEAEASRPVFEADTKHPVPEVGTSRPIVEADASQPIVEADVSGQIVEADSQQLTEKP